MKKFLLVGLVAVCAAAIMFTGCEGGGAGDSGSNGAPGAIVLSGTPSKAVIDDAFKATDVVIFDSVGIGTNVIVVPTGKTLKAYGTLTVGATGILVAVDGTLDVSKVTTVAGNTSGVIVAPDAVQTTLKAATGGNTAVYPKNVTSISAPLAEAVYIPSITVDTAALTNIGTTYGLYTSKATLSGALDISGTDVKLYALEAEAASGSSLTLGTAQKFLGGIKALGNIAIAANPGAPVTVDMNGHTVTVPAAGAAALTLTSSAAGAIIAPDSTTALVISAVEVKSGNDISVKSDVATVTATVSGAGTLLIPGAVTSVTTTGAGNVAITKAEGVTLATASFGSTGMTTFTGNLVTGDATFGNVTFNGTYAPTGDVTANGNVQFNETATIATTKAITLKTGKAITIAATKQLNFHTVGANGYFKAGVITAGGTDDAVLTATSTTGITYAASSSTGSTLSSTADLVLPDTKKLTLTGAITKLSFGKTDLSGNDAVFTATQNITIGYTANGSTISSAAADGKLTTTGTAAVITQNAGADNVLAIGENVTIDIQASDSKIVLKNNGVASADTPTQGTLTLAAVTSKIQTASAVNGTQTTIAASNDIGGTDTVTINGDSNELQLITGKASNSKLFCNETTNSGDATISGDTVTA